MNLDPTGAVNHNWNYSNPSKEGFTETLIGTVKHIQSVQAREFTRNGTPGAPSFWPEGNPKMNFRMILVTPENEIRTFTYQPASKAQRQNNTGVHMALFNLSGQQGVSKLIGQTLKLSTKTIDPNTGEKYVYGAGNPRLFDIQLYTEGGPYGEGLNLPAEYLLDEVLCNDAVSGGQVQPQNIQTPQVPQMQNGYYAPPQPVYQQPVQQQPMQPQPIQTPQVIAQPVQPQMPAGMDPEIAAAMQNLGATNVQPVAGVVYDESIPF